MYARETPMSMVKCQTWRDVTPAVPSKWYCQCLSPCCLEESVIGNSLYTLAGYAGW
jgi:hypothetical protein